MPVGACTGSCRRLPAAQEQVKLQHLQSGEIKEPSRLEDTFRIPYNNRDPNFKAVVTGTEFWGHDMVET